MKSHLTIYFLLLVTFSFAQHSQTHWKSELNFGDGISMITFLKVTKTDNHFTITSSKNADIRMFGFFKARFGRLLGRLPKKGVFITINGIQKGDSLFGNVKMPMFDKIKFKGFLKNDLFSGEIIKNDTIKVGNITSVKTNENQINYEYLYPKTLKITENNIYSKKVLKTKKWKKFNKKIKHLFANAQDDIELFLGFNTLSANLPFSHYNLTIKNDNKKNNDNNKINDSAIIFKEEKNNTAYLKIKDFISSQNELATILPKIVENKYKNLIIDLRNNGGGGVAPAFELAKFIVNKTVNVGYFVTNKLKYSGYNPKLFETLPKVKPKTTKEFLTILKKGKGAKLIFSKSNEPIFLGNLYVLTNKYTGSTCEPIVYLLKTNKRATIIGENTAGAMLSATFFDIDKKYKLFLPIADFYTYDGVRLEGLGVKPNIETTSDEALDKALSIIKERENK